jgi:hypothetical protein
MWSQVMLRGGISWGCLSPSRRCRVVLVTNVPHDQGRRESFFCSAILGTCRKGGSGGLGSLRATKDVVRALWRWACMPLRGMGVSRRGSNIAY